MQPRQGGIWLVLGGAPSVWADLTLAKALLGREAHGIIACNLAGIEFPGELHAWASLHPEHMAKWARERLARGGNGDFRAFSPVRHPNCPLGAVVTTRWEGSSGLYAAQVALEGLQAAGVILCGVPMAPEAGHFAIPGRWSGGESYRKGFAAALPHIGARVRSMGGWTAKVFGQPTAEWLAALSGAKPLGGPRPIFPTRRPMHTVTNVSTTTQRFNARDPQGGFFNVLLQPGESGDYDVDANQAKYQEGGPLTAKPIPDRRAAAKAAKAGNPAPLEPALTRVTLAAAPSVAEQLEDLADPGPPAA